MGRPLKHNEEKLSYRLPHIRCTKYQYDLIKLRAERAGLSLSEYIRQIAQSGQIKVRTNRIDFEAVSQLRKIGININQQTKELHKHGQLPSALPPLWRKLELLLDELLTTL